ncbi:MAG TPA: UbiA family prenyltransferase, partial [Candidatus Limnocylindrales bacterium]|nr:UbiA family prenyltransferase [Candidatus Limnocylindrales bacterium]
MFKTYYQLTKPGIIYGNLLTAIGGFLYASEGRIDILLLLALAVGMSLVIASGCVFNNYLDRDIDAKMQRTQKRALVSAEISTQNALIYGAVLGISGAAILALYTNLTTLLLGIVGFVSYVGLYTYLKRRTIHGTLIGTIPGATPLIAGYTAVNGQLGLDALLLFLIMV